MCGELKQQEQKCDEKILPENATPKTSTFMQTWNGKEWEPTEMKWTYEGKECGFVCAD